MIRHNTGYKLLALGVALALWFYVNSERNPQSRRVISVPVEIQNIGKGYAVELSRHDPANITISGLKTAVESVNKDDVSAWIDVGELTSGKGISVLDKDMVVNTRIPGVDNRDIDVTVVPRTVHVKIEAIGSRRLPIEAKMQSAPPLGYSYSGPAVTPGAVTISGRVSGVTRVKRAIVSLPNSASSSPVDDYFNVVPLDSGGSVVQGVKLEPKKVRVQLSMTEVPATKMVLVSPNIYGEPKYPAKVNKILVTPSSVTIEGKPAVLNDISTISTDRIALDSASSTVTGANVELRLPPGVKVVGRDTVNVTVYIGQSE